MATHKEFFCTNKLENHTGKGKGRPRRKKRGKETLSFYNTYVLWGWLLAGKRSGGINLIGGNVFKNPLRYILS